MTTMQKLLPLFKTLHLSAMGSHLVWLNEDPQTADRPYMDIIEELLNAELTLRASNALNRRLKQADIRHKDACMENVDFSVNRGLNKAKLLNMANCDWIRNHQNCVITGKTGCGKTWIAAALTNAACRQGFKAKFVRLPRLLKRLGASHLVDKQFEKELNELKRVDLLILDDWGIGQMDAIARTDLLEVIEDRCGTGSTIITSVLPIETWGQYIGDPTLADSILDRVITNAHHINIEGPSMRDLKKYGAIKD